MTLSIRARMTAWYVALLGAVLAAAAGFVVVRLRGDLVREVDGALGPAAAQIAVDYAREGDREFADSAGTVLKGERATAQLLSRGGAVRVAFGDDVSARPMLSATERAAALAGRSVAVSRPLGAGGARFRLDARRVVRAGVPEVVVAGQSLRPIDRSVRQVEELLLLVGPVALLVTALGGWWLARRALEPIEAMTTTASAIDSERLGDRVATPRGDDEVAHLARTLNAMLARIEQGALEQRRLVADASHELRTPLAAMRTELDVSLRTDALEAAARAVLLSAREEVDRLARTVDDLLVLAAADDGEPAARERLDLAGLVEGVVDRMRGVAEREGVLVVCACGPAEVTGDPSALDHAVRNLLENAIAFSPPGGTVRVSTEHAGGVARVSVEDEGPGVPPELRERVFDRFFRVDP
ncbi:MAG: two-component system, OmpR family, heavy metal sensor histidine kinase CusS, partial [Solirubrobacteraceae bacterium]|nr:two-component system, OmpR family, heavy metal sensor histidine kinase CusS [Solirubrobacteraceae bacterium]